MKTYHFPNILLDLGQFPLHDSQFLLLIFQRLFCLLPLLLHLGELVLLVLQVLFVRLDFFLVVVQMEDLELDLFFLL